MQEQTRQVQNYGLAEWLQDVQKAFHDGYEFDFEDNFNYPQQIGHLYTSTMKLRSNAPAMTTILPDNEAQQQVLLSDTQAVPTEVNQPVKRGPKPKQQ